METARLCCPTWLNTCSLYTQQFRPNSAPAHNDTCTRVFRAAFFTRAEKLKTAHVHQLDQGSPSPVGGPPPVCSLLGTGRHTGGEQPASQRSFICLWPSLALPTEPSAAPIRGKIFFHKTCPWCQKGWGPLS